MVSERHGNEVSAQEGAAVLSWKVHFLLGEEGRELETHDRNSGTVVRDTGASRAVGEPGPRLSTVLRSSD